MKNYKNIFLILLLIISAETFAQVFPIHEVLITGERSKRINIVFLGDGYTSGEMDKYNSNVQGVVQELFNAEPYSSYRNYFNVYAIEVPSIESGSTHPGNATDEPGGLDVFSSNTYFKSTFDFAGIHRLLVPQNYGAIDSVLSSNFPDWDIVFMIVNHFYYGGSGGSYATTSAHEASFEVAIHELGHSFANLADEYDYGNNGGFESVNTTAATMFENIKWNKWILESTPLPTPETQEYANVVGLFEGAAYKPTGWYRPKLNCKMNSLYVPFCEVCSEQTVLSIYNYVNIIDAIFPEEQILNISAQSTKEFAIELIDPQIKNLSVQWFLDNSLISENANNFLFDASAVSDGTHKLKVVVKDNTIFVRNDPNNLLLSEFEWTVNVGNTTSTDDDILKYEFSFGQNYPNPFNPSTTINYTLTNSSNASLKIYDVFGREVATLFEEYKSAGNYKIEFNAGDIASGVYFYVLSAGEFRDVKKLILLK